jgi:tRNA wybutosine-synthesizing protein 1
LASLFFVHLQITCPTTFPGTIGANWFWLDPHINEFLGLLHQDRISSFLVTNAQHPSALRTLHRPTQLYVSIDASNKESLKAIDRPLFKDFWERTLECLDILRERQEELRTVYRFPLVRGFNMDEIPGYGGLIDRGRPWLIEIKGITHFLAVSKVDVGVTYCGKSDESSLTMNNVPFYEEVVEFAKGIVEELNRRRTESDLPEYAIAAEHAHRYQRTSGTPHMLISVAVFW